MQIIKKINIFLKFLVILSEVLQKKVEINQDEKYRYQFESDKAASSELDRDWLEIDFSSSET